MKFKRVLLKLSGESLSSGFGIDKGHCESVSSSIKKCVNLGLEASIVIGGGNFWRGRSNQHMDRCTSDHIGMLGTTMNALAINDAFKSGVDKIIVNGYDLKSSIEAVELSKEYENLYVAIGIGPENIDSITDEDINSVTPNYEANLLKSVMKVLELDSNINIPKGTEIKFEYGLLVNGAYEYLDYGNYIVAKEPEKQEDTLSYKITCYDKMLYSMKDYEHIDIPYPCTIKQYLVALCNKIGLQFKDSDFANANRQITNELFMTVNEDGTYSSMGYTYRDVLDQIAETTGGCICMTLDDKVEVRYINETNDTIDEEYINKNLKSMDNC